MQFRKSGDYKRRGDKQNVLFFVSNFARAKKKRGEGGEESKEEEEEEEEEEQVGEKPNQGMFSFCNHGYLDS